MNFLDLGGRGRLEDDKLAREREGERGGMEQLGCYVAQSPRQNPTKIRKIQVKQDLFLASSRSILKTNNNNKIQNSAMSLQNRFD